MRRTDFAYDLPEDLIAQRPPAKARGAACCICSTARAAARSAVHRSASLLRAGDLLVFNDTRVIPARIVGASRPAARSRSCSSACSKARRHSAHAHASKPLRGDVPVSLPGGAQAACSVAATISSSSSSAPSRSTYFERHGSMPLPPYIERARRSRRRDALPDCVRARAGRCRCADRGSAFRRSDARALRERGVDVALRHAARRARARSSRCASRPRRAPHARASAYDVSADVSPRSRARAAAAGASIAVGTTVVRALESARSDGRDSQPFAGETRLFITPGFQFRVVDALVTNFHLPRVDAADAGVRVRRPRAVLRAYRHAVDERYRFFSYGDAMFLTPRIDRR